MASVTTGYEDDLFIRSVKDTLLARVRKGLKDPLMKEAEKLVDAAVDEALASLKVTIEAHIEQAHRELNVEVLVQRLEATKSA